jgi:hypothetical protein
MQVAIVGAADTPVFPSRNDQVPLEQAKEEIPTEAVSITTCQGVGLIQSLVLTLAKIAGFVALMLIVGTRLIPALLHYVAHTGSRELFRLSVLLTLAVTGAVAKQTCKERADEKKLAGAALNSCAPRMPRRHAPKQPLTKSYQARQRIASRRNA